LDGAVDGLLLNLPFTQEDATMSLRLASYLMVGFVATGFAHAQATETPLQLASLEWLIQDCDVVVRGVVADVAADQNWNIVTFDVLETLKGAKAQRLQFAAHGFDKGDASLAQSKQSKREVLWILKRQAAVPGEAPNREKMLARHKIDLYAPFLPGRPGEPSLPMIPLGPADSDAEPQPPAFLTLDLRLLKTSNELVTAIRSAIAATKGGESSRVYGVVLPQEIAQRTGFSRAQNFIAVPVDRRLEEFARRLVQTPGDFLAKNDSDHRHLLRVEGVKALRLFPSEKNLSIVRAWLDDPGSTQAFKGDRQALVPAMPAGQKTEKVDLPQELAQIPEIHFQKPLTKAMKTENAQLHTAVTIDAVHFMNQKKTDAFIKALISKRSDLAGLSFAMGDSCRMKPETSQQFVAALDAFHKAESEDAKKVVLMNIYQGLTAEKAVAPSASVAALMQVLGPEAGEPRVNLVKYLAGLPQIDATRALAKLAIFSPEPDVFAVTAAVEALKSRDPKDYNDILVAGLKYPWPAVAERSSQAIAKLARKDLVPQLIDMLENPDPRAPQMQEIDGKKVAVVRELVRVNHHHNCLLCHAPATGSRDKASQEEIAKLEGLTAQIPVPSESMVAYYRPSSPDILVRFDVTYLRQDFSLKLKVADAEPWPEMQRYDFLVRTREVTDKEVLVYKELLQPKRSEDLSPYRRAALSALRELTGQDAAPTATAWRKLAGL
jgi:hypothetical protein